MLKTSLSKLTIFILTSLLMVFFIGMSIVFGYTNTSIQLAYEAFTQFNESNEHLIIRTVRLPRALIAAACGASLAITGVLMQTLTKNPLASPGILGINAGAGFAVVLSITIFHISSLQAFAWISFLGAGLAAICVYVISSASTGGLTPMKITLAGSAISALFSSLTQGILVTNEAGFEQVLFWLAGSVQGRKLELLAAVSPYLFIGWTAALMIAPRMNVLAMGDDVAVGLGLKLGRIKIFTGIIVILLAGSSVAAAGPIGFIGIIIPHIAKKIIGLDHRWLIPYSALLGASLLLAADIAARYIIMPREVPVGVMTALIGTPFFIYIARKGLSQS